MTSRACVGPFTRAASVCAAPVCSAAVVTGRCFSSLLSPHRSTSIRALPRQWSPRPSSLLHTSSARWSSESSLLVATRSAPSASATSSTSSFQTHLEHRFDLVVIGSGPAGQKAAINAAKLKKRVCIVDKRSMLGGVCVHTGTIPSKTFREAILYLTGYRQRGFYGKASTVRRDQIHSADILDRVRKVEGWESATILDQLHRNDITIFDGTARFLDAHHLEISPSTTANASTSSFSSSPAPDMTVSSSPSPSSPSSSSPSSPSPSSSSSSSSSSSGSNSSSSPRVPPDGALVIRGEHIMLTVGTRPAHNESMYQYSSPLIFDSDAILQSRNWDRVRHLIVVGSGVIAMEYASMFNALPGCRVTIIDEKPTMLDFVDGEIVQTLRYIMGRQGASFRLGEKIVKVDAKENAVTVHMESGKSATGDALFYAVGRQSNTDTLNLDAAAVQMGKRGLLNVNEYFQTNVPHIYAAGDIIGFPALASTAMEQGRLASGHMFGATKKFHPVFPYGIYTIPEISVIGKSEQQLTRERIPYEVGKAKFDEIAKGQMVGGQYIDGFLKLLFCPHTRKLYGAACIGESAAEIIHIAQVVLTLGGTIDYFVESVFNYPTMAETYRVAALDGLARIGLSCVGDSDSLAPKLD